MSVPTEMRLRVGSCAALQPEAMPTSPIVRAFRGSKPNLSLQVSSDPPGAAQGYQGVFDGRYRMVIFAYEPGTVDLWVSYEPPGTKRMETKALRVFVEGEADAEEKARCNALRFDISERPQRFGTE